MNHQELVQHLAEHHVESAAHHRRIAKAVRAVAGHLRDGNNQELADACEEVATAHEEFAKCHATALKVFGEEVEQKAVLRRGSGISLGELYKLMAGSSGL